jgi:hypothetical protein
VIAGTVGAARTFSPRTDAEATTMPILFYLPLIILSGMFTIAREDRRAAEIETGGKTKR